MAKINFEDALNLEAKGSTGHANRVNFFKLANDGDEAIVRFMYDDASEFEILSIHRVNLSGKFRAVNCIRQATDPLSDCPICAKGEAVVRRFYAKMLVYQTDDNGNVVAVPCVWDRPLSVAQTLKSYLDNYGSLKEVLCKVVRHGKAGDMSTRYEIVPNLSARMYPPEKYAVNDSLDNFSALGVNVMDRSYDELVEYVQTGNFPMRNQNSGAAPAGAPAAEVTAKSNTPSGKMPWETDAPVRQQGSTRFY